MPGLPRVREYSWRDFPRMVIPGPCWDGGLALRWACSGCRGGAAAWGTAAALDGSVTQLHTASFSFGNKDNKHVTWDLEGASLSPLGMYLTRFPSFPSPILSLFFGTTFPCFLFSQFSFFFFLCIEVFLCLFWAGQVLKRSEINSKVLLMQKQYIKPKNHKHSKKQCLFLLPVLYL